MNRNTLVRRRHGRFLRDTDPTGGGGGAGGTDGSGAGAGTDGGAGGAGAGNGAGGGSGGAGGGSGDGDRGFPANTPLEQMNGEQREAYWRHYARHHEARANARSDYDQVKAKADQLDELQRQQMTPSEQAIAAAKAAGRDEALRTANEEQVQNLLRVSLAARGKKDADLDELVAAANPAAFITDGKVVADKVTSYAAKLAGTSGSGGGGDLGQGRREGQTKPSVASGAEMFASRRGKKAGANA